MPPPTANDPWLAARRFGIVIDAGSSGSRLQIYSWRDARVVRSEEGPASYESLPKVEKGTKDNDSWVAKVEPGISTFGSNIDGIPQYLAPLLEHARSLVPPSLQHETPLFLLATAGMRLLPPSQQAAVLQATCDFLKFHAHFRIDKPSSSGPCGSSVRIISGEDEGLFGWIATNYLMDGFSRQHDQPATYGFLDMGGASTQIAFEPGEKERVNTPDLIDVRLRLIGGDDIHHRVFVTTWLGYGTNQARQRYAGELITRHEESRKHKHDRSDASDLVHDPCLPKGLQLKETPVYSSSVEPHNRLTHTLVGTGSFEECLKAVTPMLNKDHPCTASPCLFNGVHVPPIDFSISHFIGVSEYWYSSEHVFGLGGAYDFVQYERAASEFCNQSWGKIQRMHEASSKQGHLGGDGEVEKGGEIISLGNWGPEVEIPRLQMQCFKSAWIINVLHEGIGMPRIVDPGGNSTGGDAIIEGKAKGKGLGRPLFQSVNEVDDTAFSWTLGKMVLEASREVPPLSKWVAPISDPETHPNSAANHGSDVVENTPPKPILAKFGADALPLVSLFPLASIFMLLFVAYRLRRYFLNNGRSAFRRLAKADSDFAEQVENGALFPGHSISSPSTPTSSWTLPSRISNILSSSTRSRNIVRSSQSPIVRQAQWQSDLHRSPSSPTLRQFNGSPSGEFPLSRSSFSLSQHLSSSDTSQFPNGFVAHSLYSQPRSRNGSQLNLTTLIPRQGASRGGSSGQQTPTKSSLFHDGA